MRRREFIKVVVGSTAVWPFTARAQQSALPVVGFLNSASPQPWENYVAGFRAGLKEAGYVDGQNVTIEFRWAEGHYDRLPDMAADLVRRKVNVLVSTGGLPSVVAAKAATSTIPIVFTTGSDPVQDGLVKSINRPGGNSTGVYLLNNSLAPKRLEVMRELVPNARVIAFLVNPHNLSTDKQVREAQIAANSIGVQLHVFNASTANDIDAAFEALVHRGAGALLMGADGIFQVQQEQVIALAALHKIPTIYEWPEFVTADGLISYSSLRSDSTLQMGIYVGRILNGAKPADLPVIQSTKFELVINLRTAKALGLDVPSTLLALADEVIE